MASWSTSAAVAAPARQPRERTKARPDEKAKPRPRARQRQRRTSRRLGAFFWIGVAGALLAGVVALNVAVLRLNMRVDDLDRQRTQLRAENAALQSQLAGAAAAQRIQAEAVRRGLHPALAQDTTFVQLTAGR